MTDRELLEMAAKACGWTPTGWGGERTLWAEDERGGTLAWMPLHEDSHAFGLLVYLGLEIVLWHEQAGVEVFCPAREPLKTLASIPYAQFDGDKRKTTRVAIVRAAAEIGATKCT